MSSFNSFFGVLICTAVATDRLLSCEFLSKTDGEKCHVIFFPHMKQSTWGTQLQQTQQRFNKNQQPYYGNKNACGSIWLVWLSRFYTFFVTLLQFRDVTLKQSSCHLCNAFSMQILGYFLYWFFLLEFCTFLWTTLARPFSWKKYTNFLPCKLWNRHVIPRLCYWAYGNSGSELNIWLLVVY